jgi:uncharacterized membrane protein
MLSGRHTLWGITRGTLDGTAYIEETNAGDNKAIRWINEELEGSPVILEAPGNSNSFSSRISTFTGSPTVIGWGTWELMWRQDRDAVDTRIRDVDTIYNTSDNDKALDLLHRYDVEYIYIGSLELNTYETEGLHKFTNHSGDYHPVYQAEGVTIFEVGRH